MFTDNFFTKLLDVKGGSIVKSVYSHMIREEICVQVVCVLDQLDEPGFRELCGVYDYTSERSWRRLATMRYKTCIKCRLPRMKTSEGKIKAVKSNWASGYERHIFLFESAAVDLLKASKNQTKTARLMRYGFDVVNRFLHSSVRRGMWRRNYSSLTYGHLIIDEKSFKKGHQYISVLGHPASDYVPDVEENRPKDSYKGLLSNSLTTDQLDSVSAFNRDIWKLFLQTAQDMKPNAFIVHGRFHLVKYLKEAIDKVRRRVVKQHDDLKQSRDILPNKPDNLTERQRNYIEAIAYANYEVSKVWHVRKNFKALFNKGKLKVSLSFLEWVEDATTRKIKEGDKVLEIFNNHQSNVINTVLINLTNAMVELLNCKIQKIKTLGREYRPLPILRLYFII